MRRVPVSRSMSACVSSSSSPARNPDR
jgi:hypothetical protein